MLIKSSSILLGVLLGIIAPCFGSGIFTNNVKILNPPGWLTPLRVETVTGKIQNTLEWDIHRVTVTWYTDAALFEKTHGHGPLVEAYSRPSDNSVHMGPRVDTKNFDGIFGHELTHVIVAQKYKTAIPKWIEEGLANRVANYGKVDYIWLAAQPHHEVTTLTHPFTGFFDSRYHYSASTAVMEMIEKKCGLHDLLQLSVGKKMETYLSTFCGITDVNADFQKWVTEKGKFPVKNLPKK